MRLDANNLFCGRSGLTFEYQLRSGSIGSEVMTLDREVFSQTAKITSARAIGVGNVGRTPGTATYTLYNTNTNQVEFKTVRYGVNKGFNSLC